MSVDVVLDLLLRWFHILAGIMWIGNSMLFNWLDRNLVKDKSHSDLSAGEIWLLHSGAFYQVEKMQLEPGKMPNKVHWFMWQNFSTWASGILLLIVVYYLGERAWLVDPEAGHISYAHALLASIGTLVLGVAGYEVLWRSKIHKRPDLLNIIFVIAMIAIAWALAQIMTPRASFIHVGVLIGSFMTANVWFVIIPAQRDLVAATESGRPQDPTLSIKAKARSVHNNYLTFPLIFIMVSNHFPVFYSHRYNWIILVVLMAGSAVVRHFMNIRWSFPAWKTAVAISGAATLALMFLIVSQPASVIEDDALADGPTVYFDEAQAILSNRCVACHSQVPSDSLFTAPPGGLVLESAEQIKKVASRIRVRVSSRTMPFRNRTAMTDEERGTIARWVAQGATLRTKPISAAPPSDTDSSAEPGERGAPKATEKRETAAEDAAGSADSGVTGN